jgi:energy-coupling factor transporter ATP-binding protein EcfA2
MLSEESHEIVARYRLGFHPEREPEMSFGANWVQDRENQLVLLDTFFSALRPEQSLCFFYAKDTPLSSSSARVLMGVGLVSSIGDSVEYNYSAQNPKLRGMLWERNVGHSIRPGFSEGFLFPYADLFLAAMENGLDPEEFVAFAPDEAYWSFSFGAEHLTHDHAIASLIVCIRALERISRIVAGPWKQVFSWLDAQLNRLWKLRGPFPGFGSALTAFLGEGGNIVAYELAETSAEGRPDGNVDPWPAFETLMDDPNQASGAAKGIVGQGFALAWRNMSEERRAALKLLSRFSLDADQAERFFDADNKPGHATDADLLRNPYLFYELDRFSAEPIGLEVIDRGMLPDQVVQEAHPLPDESRLEDKVDPRRVRALLVYALEQAAASGHTLQPRAWLTKAIRDLELGTDCPASAEVLDGVRDLLAGVMETTAMADGSPAYQLQRFVETKGLISGIVEKRLGLKSKRHAGSWDWRCIVDETLGEMPADKDDRAAEELARTEKAAALKEIFASRLSVLIGPAGTGKTTLLKMLCAMGPVADGAVLLLAPTGKARVQLERKTGQSGGMTLAQFLIRYGGRYDPETGIYRVKGTGNRCSDFRTVIVDECSMLTEEQLAALIDAIKGVDRLVLVGDPRQLPPIGSGRAFVDIVRRLAPEAVEHSFPRVSRGYAELTIPRRQMGSTRADLLLASWFCGSDDPSSDEIWDRLETEQMEELRFVSWDTEQQLQDKLLDVLVEELSLAGQDDELGFGLSLGGSEHNKRCYFWRTHGGDDAAKAERWQVISPIRGGISGVESLNRLIQQRFRKGWIASANETGWGRKINAPQGRQGIIYGDKVINLQNSSSRKVYPKDRPPYLANGDIGLVVGAYKTKKAPKVFRQLDVELTSQPGYAYTYWLSEFGEEGSSPLELAYALTVHKTQGSEFGITFVVLPNPCWLLSRELLYTALTRQRQRVVILHQGDIRQLRHFSNEQHSDVAQRLSNLFQAPNPIPFEFGETTKFLEAGLIHRTRRGELVRSKSEVIIANELYAQGIDYYEYESPLKLPSGETRYPDFTIVDDDTGETFYWEHLGLLHNPDYASRWRRKLAAYRAAGIIPHDETTDIGDGQRRGILICTRDDSQGGIDAQAIANVIKEVLQG